MKRFFAVDLGADSGRCITGHLENGRLVMEELHRFPTRYFVLEGSCRWNIFRFYEEILTGLKKYAEKYGKELFSLGVDAWGCDYAFVDGENKLLDIPYSYRDKRTQGSLEKIMPHKAWLYGKTGIQFLEFNTLNQLMAEYGDPKSRIKRAVKFLFIADALHVMLGASPLSEYTVASISMMADTKEKRWDPEICEKFDIPVNICPPLCFAGDCIGTLRDDIADLAGLNRGVKIIAPAVHDTASAALAVPAREESFAYISSGTWSIVGTELDSPVLDKISCDLNISNSGGALGKSLFLKNVMGLWILQQSKRCWNMSDSALDYNAIMNAAKNAKPLSAFIDPDDDSFFNPENMPLALCEYLSKTGQGKFAPGDVGSLSRIIYESLAMKYRNVIERIEKATGRKIRVIHVTGGGSKDGLLNSFIAQAAGLTVKAGPSEGTAMGNLLLQAYGSGEIFSISQIRQIVANTSEIKEYTPSASDEWDKAYKVFLRLL
jgi:rhamnulokinase